MSFKTLLLTHVVNVEVGIGNISTEAFHAKAKSKYGNADLRGYHFLEDKWEPLLRIY